MQFEAPRLVAFALGTVGLVLLLAATPSSPAAGQEQPPPEETGGLARTEVELGALGRLADMPDRVPRNEAIDAYNRGLENLDRARRLGDEAAAGDGDRATRRAAKAQKSYTDAIDRFRAAVELEPDFYQALGGLGYALLRTGQYEAAIEAYDRALATGPLYAAAMAERAEACLWLDRIEETKSTYAQLRQTDRELAAELLVAMRRWLAARRADPAGLPEHTIEGFATWIDARAEPVGSTGGGRQPQPQAADRNRP